MDDQTQIEAQRKKLREAILGGHELEAENLVKALGDAGTPVLAEFVHDEDVDRRRVAVELLSIDPGIAACKLLLERLSDSEMAVRDLAISEIQNCDHPQLLPELLALLKTHRHHTDVCAELVLVIGEIGSKEQISLLREYRQEARQTSAVTPGEVEISHGADLDHNIGLALCRLGDEKAREELIKRLRKDDAWSRVDALSDCLYVDDPDLVIHFGPALNDHTDVNALSIPEEPPMEYARVSDTTVFTMVQLGVPLSFELEMLARLGDAQLREAQDYVKQLKGA